MIKRILTVGGFTLLSRITGFVRDIILAAILGAGPVADAFFVALRLPNHFRAIFAEGAFNAAFVPAYARIREEHDRTLAMVRKVADIRDLLEETPALALSLTRRDPYLDPLNHIQIKLLARARNLQLGEPEQEHWLEPLLRSINAIASGMRNTG